MNAFKINPILFGGISFVSVLDDLVCKVLQQFIYVHRIKLHKPLQNTLALESTVTKKLSVI